MTSPFGVYIHMPFCRVRCSYCAFAISTRMDAQQAYVAAITGEIGRRMPAGVTADTVYFGGGTPSKTADGDIAAIMEQVRHSAVVAPGAELTIEANPEDVTTERIARWQELGFNRISLGVQSFVDSELFPLGRGHTSSVALKALRLLKRSGVSLNVDLMAGLPNQNVDSFHQSLRTAIAEGADHLSLYMLDLEEGSALDKQVRFGRISIPQDETVAEQYRLAVDVANASGLHQYEISNFARAGHESRHNLKYWNREPYAGFGLGAHSFDGSSRQANSRSLDEYLDLALTGEFSTFRETLTPEDERHERLFLALRQKRGIEYSELVKLAGSEGERWTERGVEEGWLESTENRVAFTTEGFLLSSGHIAALF